MKFIDKESSMWGWSRIISILAAIVIIAINPKIQFSNIPERVPCVEAGKSNDMKSLLPGL